MPFCCICHADFDDKDILEVAHHRYVCYACAGSVRSALRAKPYYKRHKDRQPRTELHNKKISEGLKQNWANRSEEDIARFAKKAGANSKAVWDRMTPEERANRVRKAHDSRSKHFALRRIANNESLPLMIRAKATSAIVNKDYGALDELYEEIDNYTKTSRYIYDKKLGLLEIVKEEKHEG